MQTEADAERLQYLGMSAERTKISGNMKFDTETIAGDESADHGIAKAFRVSLRATPVILAASTHAPEETIVLNSLLHMFHRSNARPRLIIAPRHPERFAEVAELLKASGLRWARRSAAADASDAIRRK